MREFARIGTFFRDEVGETLFAELVRLVPEGQCGSIGHAFRVRISSEDERGQEVLRRLHDAGWKPLIETWRPRAKGKEYRFELEREYEPSDWESCEYLELSLPQEAYNTKAIHRNIDGEILVFELSQATEFDFFGGLSQWRFVSAHAKEVLELGGLNHVLFRPTVFVPRVTEFDSTLDMELDHVVIPDLSRSRDRDVLVAYWEIDSDFILPPLSPSVSLTDSAGRSIRGGDFDAGVHRREGSYMHPELHYRASDLAGLGPFDLARAFEPFGNHRTYSSLNCPLIASRKFYEWCVSNGLRAGWVPVRIDPD